MSKLYKNFPKQWVIKCEGKEIDEFRSTVLVDLKKEFRRNYEGVSGYYYGVMDLGSASISHHFINYSDVPSNTVILSLEEYKQLKTGIPLETKNESTMTKISIKNASIIQDAYNQAPNAELKQLIKQNVDVFELSTTKEFLLQILERDDVCDAWKEKIKKEFDLDEKFDLHNGKFHNVPLFNVSDSALIAVRSYGEYKNKSFYLNGAFEWEMERDDQGVLVLIPTPIK